MNTPNAALAYAVSATGWSNRELARRINALAAQRGHRGIAIDHTRVGRWIRCGEQPRAPIPELLTELLGESLGQSRTPESLGLVRLPRLHIELEATEFAALLDRAAAAKVSPQEFARGLISAALAGRRTAGGKRHSAALQCE